MMKKAYQKPQILFESFQMSSNIASGCELVTNLPTQGACGYPTRDGVVFVDMLTGCDIGNADGPYNTFCYHVPYAESNLFAS
jgi:hypothetical protein